MNPRERILATVVGAMAVLLGGFFIQSRISSWFDAGRKRISTLESELTKQKRLVAQSAKASARLAELEQKSLPPQAAIARSAYQNWLLTAVQKANLADQQVNAISSRAQGDIYVQQTFSVSGKGTIVELVQLLHEFYRADYLHRISKLMIRPMKESKQLELQMTVEALSLNSAPPATRLEPRVSQRLALPKLDDYTASIVGRNLFAMPNHPPQLASPLPPRAETNRMLDMTVKASDPDKLDKLTYKLTKSPSPDARLDATTGRLQWIPKSPGKYEFEISVVDDGLPALPDTKAFAVTVTDPLPPPPVEPPKLTFDEAKFTVLTAVLDVDGSSEVWLHIRPRGQTLRLREGEKFEVGSVKGVVSAIGLEDFVFQADGKTRRLSKGEVLEQAPIQ